MATYIVRAPFPGYTVGQVVYSDADAAVHPGSVITDAVVAAHTANLITVASSSPGGGSSSGTSTTGTSSSGTSTTGTATGTGGGTAAPLVYVVSDTLNADGSITFLDSTGASHTVAAGSGLTTAQSSLLSSLGSAVNSAGQITAKVIGDISSGLIGTMTAAQVGALVSSNVASLTSIGGVLTSHGTSLSALGTQATSLAGSLSATGSLATAASGSVSALGTTVGTLSSQVSTLSTMVNNSSTGTIQAQVSSIGTTVTSLAGSVSTLGTTVAAASTSASSAVSTAGSASALASSLGTTVSSQGTSLTALGLTLSSTGTSLTSLAGSLSTVGTQAASAASTAGSAAAAASSLGTTVSANSTLLASHTASLSTLGTQAASATSMAGSASALASSLGTTVTSLGTSVSNNTSLLASHSTSLSTLGTLVAAAKPINGSTVVGTSNGTITYALTSTVGTTTSTSATFAVPPGTLGTGDTSANIVTTAVGGPQRTLARQRGERVNVIDFGASPNNRIFVSASVANGGLNCNKRADLVAYTNPNGVQTYAALATAPLSMGGGYWFRLPLPTTSTAGGTSGATNPTPTIAVAAAFTTRAAAYYDENGWLYIPVNNTPDAGTTTAGNAPIFNFYEDWTVTGGSLPTGSFIWSIIENELCLGPMASGITIPAGTVLMCGADMTKFSTGMGFWGPYGISDLNTITAVNAKGGTITLAKPLTKGTLPYNQNYDGVGQFEQCWAYNPITDAQISSSLTMNVVAKIAAYYNTQTPYSNDEVYYPAGDYYESHGTALAGRAVNFSGAGKHQVFIRCDTDDIAFKVFPPAVSSTHYRDLEFYGENGTPAFAISVDGQGFPTPQLPVPSPNVNLTTATFENIYSVGGCLSLIDCQQMGDMRFEHIGSQGPGKTNGATATVRTLRCTEYKAYDVGSTNQACTFMQVGYVEHPAIFLTGQNQCLRGYDGRRASRYNGVGGLLFTLVGGDGDIVNSGIHLRFFINFSIGPANLSMPNYVADNGQRPTNAAIILDGCYNGSISGLNGGCATAPPPPASGGPAAGTPGAQDGIQLNRANVNGSYVGTSYITTRGVNLTGWKCAVRIGAGCIHNDIDARLADDKQVYGYSLNSVIDETSGDGSNLIQGPTGTLKTSANLAANQTIQAAVSTIAMTANDDATGAFSNNLILCVANGVYEASGWLQVAASGSSQTVGTSTVVSSPAGTLVQMQIYGQNPGLSAPAEAYDTTADGGVFYFTKTFFAQAGSKIGMSAAAAVPTVAIGAGMTVRLVHETLV